jgi:hypothetical protein
VTPDLDPLEELRKALQPINTEAVQPKK